MGVGPGAGVVPGPDCVWVGGLLAGGRGGACERIGCFRVGAAACARAACERGGLPASGRLLSGGRGRLCPGRLHPKSARCVQMSVE